MFCNIINVVIVTFDQLNVSLLSKSINFLKNTILLTFEYVEFMEEKN